MYARFDTSGGPRSIFDDRTFAFVSAIDNWVARHPEVNTFVYDGVPPGFSRLGGYRSVEPGHNRIDLPGPCLSKWP